MNAAVNSRMAQSLIAAIAHQQHIPKADCKNCYYGNLPVGDGDHCYMFGNKPETHCAQFIAVSQG